LLYGPKLLAVASILRDAPLTRAHGGTGALVGGMFWESLFSTLVAPIVMLQHSWYVFSILMGIATGWNSQTRTDRGLPVGLVARNFAIHTLIGAAAALLLWNYACDCFDWFVPLLAGMLLSIPLVAISSSAALGLVTRQEGLFLIPSETRGLKVLDRAHRLAAGREGVSGNMQQLVLEDAQVRDLHLALLAGASAAGGDLARLGKLRQQAARHETSAFSRDDWTLLLSDCESLRALS